MNEKLLSILNVVVDALDVYLCSMTKAKFKHSVICSVKKWALWGVILIVLLLSTWITLLELIFFYLDSICFTHTQAVLAVLAINLIGLLILVLCLRRLKKQVVAIRRSGLGVLMAYIIKLINDIRHKPKN